MDIPLRITHWKTFLPRAHPELSCPFCSCSRSVMLCSAMPSPQPLGLACREGPHVDPLYLPLSAYHGPKHGVLEDRGLWPVQCLQFYSTSYGESPCESRHSGGPSFWVLCPSSSTFWLGCKHFVGIGAGITDEDYRGNAHIVLFHFDKEKFEVNKKGLNCTAYLWWIFLSRNKGSSSFRWH